MGFLSPVIRPKAISTEMERLIRENFGGGSTSSGVAVNSESAMRMITVQKCVRVLYNCISQLPCHLMEEDENEKKSKAKRHPLYRVIGKRPNGWMAAPQFWGLAIVHVCLRGNFYAFKVVVNEQVKELLPIHPDRIHEVVQNDDWSLTYKIATKNGGVQDYPQSKIFHLRGMSYDGITGINPIQYARECIASGLAAERFIGNYFGKGMHPGAVIRHPQFLDPKTHANLWEAFKKKYAGLANSQDLMLLDEDMKIEFPPIKLVDQQFLDEQKFTDAQICGLFGVPLFLVQSGDRPETYASAGEFKRTFVDTVIAPIAANFETTIDMSCIPENEQDRFYTKYNLNVLLRGNPKERAEFYSALIGCKMLNPNEGRAFEDWNAYDGGDVYENPNTSSPSSTAAGANK